MNGYPRIQRMIREISLSFVICLFGAHAANAIENADCLACHGEKTFGSEFAKSVHRGATCVNCHEDLAAAELPHNVPVVPVNCGSCHEDEQKHFMDSLHGKALARGDPLSPRCQNCHGYHDILPVKDKNSHVSALRIPFVCGSCHSEASPVQRQRNIHQDHIIENYSESIHAEGLFNKGLSVSATCISCHNAHQILPHTDKRSSIARENVAATCEKCHSQIESVHRKVIRGELWQKKPESIPVCIDCHQPHKARRVFYDQGVADADCLMCHGKSDIKSSVDGR